jgi:hypothetical protein
MSLVNGPHTFVLVSVFVVLDTETFLAVITPVTDVAGGVFPLFTLNRAIFLLFLFRNPVSGSVSSVLLSLCVIEFPEMEEVRLLLETSRNLFLDLLRILSSALKDGGVV